MRYQVPQFIEVEDKVFGPFTVRQFLYLGGAFALALIIYRFLGFTIGIIPMMAIGFLGFLLAFAKHNNRPFITLLESAFYYGTSKKLYLWRKNTPKLDINPESIISRAPVQTVSKEPFIVPKMSSSKLKELTWSLDIKENINPVTGAGGETNTR
jgi:hypothetical protein